MNRRASTSSAEFIIHINPKAPSRATTPTSTPTQRHLSSDYTDEQIALPIHEENSDRNQATRSNSKVEPSLLSNQGDIGLTENTPLLSGLKLILFFQNLIVLMNSLWNFESKKNILYLAVRLEYTLKVCSIVMKYILFYD